MKKNFFFIFGALITICFSSCYYDKEALLYPNQTACTVPTTVSFNTHVVPILQRECVACHSAAIPNGNIRLDNHAVVVSSIANNKLYGSISWTGGISPMPKGGAKMSQCNIDIIKKWIDSGAPNN
jgi:hypothetical protein